SGVGAGELAVVERELRHQYHGTRRLRELRTGDEIARQRVGEHASYRHLLRLEQPRIAVGTVLLDDVAVGDAVEIQYEAAQSGAREYLQGSPAVRAHRVGLRRVQLVRGHDVL